MNDGKSNTPPTGTEATTQARAVVKVCPTRGGGGAFCGRKTFCCRACAPSNFDN